MQKTLMLRTPVANRTASLESSMRPVRLCSLNPAFNGFQHFGIFCRHAKTGHRGARLSLRPVLVAIGKEYDVAENNFAAVTQERLVKVGSRQAFQYSSSKFLSSPCSHCRRSGISNEETIKKHTSWYQGTSQLAIDEAGSFLVDE